MAQSHAALKYDCNKEVFQTAQLDWVDKLLSQGALLFQREWMTKVLKKAFRMKVQVFDNCLR